MHCRIHIFYFFILLDGNNTRLLTDLYQIYIIVKKLFTFHQNFCVIFLFCSCARYFLIEIQKKKKKKRRKNDNFIVNMNKYNNLFYFFILLQNSLSKNRLICLCFNFKYIHSKSYWQEKNADFKQWIEHRIVQW